MLFASGKTTTGINNSISFFVRILLLCLFISGCSVKNEPAKKESLNDQEIDWLIIYENELNSARENDDHESWMFFWPEYLKEFDKTRKYDK